MHAVSQQSDEEKRLRDLFLKSRQQMEIVPTPTPMPRPTPDPAPSPGKQPFVLPSAEATPGKPIQPGPTQTATEKPEESAAPSAPATPSPTASTPVPRVEIPSATPKKKHRWFLFGKHDDGESIVV